MNTNNEVLETILDKILFATNGFLFHKNKQVQATEVIQDLIIESRLTMLEELVLELKNCKSKKEIIGNIQEHIDLYKKEVQGL